MQYDGPAGFNEFIKMNNLAKLSLIFILLTGGIGCNQSTKLLAKNLLQIEAPKSYLKDTLRTMYSENTGAFLGLGDSFLPVVQTLLHQLAVQTRICSEVIEGG